MLNKTKARTGKSVFYRISSRRHDDQVLHVTPGQVGVGLEGESAHAGGDGGRGAGAGVLVGADVIRPQSILNFTK